MCLAALLKHRAKNAGGRSGRGTPVRTFPKAAVYDTSRPTVFGLRDEAEHRARLKRVGHCFAPALLPDLETVMRTEIARLLRVLDEQRGKKCDMHRLSRYYTLDVSGKNVRLLAPSFTFEMLPSLRAAVFPVAISSTFAYHILSVQHTS
jgi:cytochrome P450